MSAIYLHDFSGINDVASDFSEPMDTFKGVEILLASYSTGNWSGDAFVLFRKDGELFEVNGSHCSCYGLEGQWEPEPTTVAALRHRLDKGTLGSDDWIGNEFADELRAVLDGMGGAA